MCRKLVIGLAFLLAILKPAIAQADSDGYYCVGPGYIAYQFGMAAPPVASHELFIVRFGKGDISQPTVFVLPQFQVHGMRCRQDAVDIAAFRAVHTVALDSLFSPLGSTVEPIGDDGRMPDWTRQARNLTHLSHEADALGTERRSLLIDREGNEYVLLITAVPSSVRECPPVVSSRVVEVDPSGLEVRAQVLYSGTPYPCSRSSFAPFEGDGGDPRDPMDTLLAALLFGPFGPTDVSPYSEELRAEFELYLTRADAYETPRPPPLQGGEGLMVDAARTAYERRLFAVAVVPDATALAVDYVSRLRLCYEWEGFSDCPQREAVFADAFHDSEPDSPFLPYLLLLSAHRWLCAAEAFAREDRPSDAIRSRQLAAERLAAALSAEQLMIRTAAERLSARGRCSVGDARD